MDLKRRIALVLQFLGISKLFFLISLRIYGKHIRVINYHDTPGDEVKNFEEQLKFYSHYYTSVSIVELELFSSSKSWDKAKPGLIISFDDGYRNNYDFAFPLLEKYNFIGWFFIPGGIINQNNADQYKFAGKHKNKFERIYKGDRILMSWNEIRHLATNHVVGCHTLTHHRMSLADDDLILWEEIEQSKKIIEEKIDRPITTFCWVGGEEHTYTQKAAEKIKRAGYKFSFMTNSYPFTFDQNPLQIQRTNIESSYPMELMKFQLCSMMDLFYYGKRKRVNLITR
jgi:peptidoglycan/xylan/chitin deacetylase (PgdA/CDA1 family)